MKRDFVAIAGDEVTTAHEAAGFYLHTFKAAIDITNGATSTAVLTQDMPRLQSRADF
jgi:hypothetical protein